MRYLAVAGRSPGAIASATSTGEVTAKEKVLERAPNWSEEQAERALRAAEGSFDEWGDIRAQTQALAEQAEERLKARERAAGKTGEPPCARRCLVGETLTHGRRPYVVLTRDEAIEQLGEVIVVPLTTVRRLPNEVELDESDGMPQACVTSLDNLSTIAKGQLVERITIVSATEERSAGLTAHEKSPASAGPFWDGSDGTRTRDLCRDRAAL
jgi:mRNA-degrading endonuclease toxin of MazEF toxin-antitoxin module